MRAGAALAVLCALAVADPLWDTAAGLASGPFLDGCASVGGLQVGLGPWPAAIRATTGSLKDVQVSAARLDVAGLAVTDVHARVGSLRWGWADLIGGASDVQVDDGKFSGEVAQADLNRYLRGLGLPGNLVVTGGTPPLRYRLGPVSVGLDVTVRAGQVVVSPSLPLPFVGSIGQSFQVPGVTLDRVVGDHSRLAVSGTFTGNLRSLVCAARAQLH